MKVLLIFLALHTAVAAKSGLLERYALTDCLAIVGSPESTTVPSLTSDSRSIMGDLSSTESVHCDPIQGTRVVSAGSPSGTNKNKILQSTATVASLQKHYKHRTNNTDFSGFSIGLSFTPVESTAVEQPILTFGGVVKDEDVWLVDVGALCAPIKISQWQLFIVVTVMDSAGSCRIMVVRDKTLSPTITTDVLVTFDATALSILIDGAPIFVGAPHTTNVLDWDAKTTLQLFGNNFDENLFAGSLQQVSLYSQAFVPSDATDLYWEDEEIVLIAQQDVEIMVIAQDDTEGVTIQITNGSNQTIGAFVLAVQVTELPKYGNLKTAASEAPITIDDFIVVPNNATGLAVRYQLINHNYFNVPTHNALGMNLDPKPETFSYRLIALDPLSLELLHASESVTVPVNVVHVNHEPILAAPAYTSKVTNTDGTSLQVVEGSIELLDRLDYDLDRVRVTVSCSAGNLTLHPAFQHLADFDTACRQRTYSSWQCFGTGVEDRRMTFVAVPINVPYILQHLQYSALNPGDEDWVEIQIYDGVGEQCLHREEHEKQQLQQPHDNDRNFTTIHRTCWEQQASILVAGYDAEEQNSQEKAYIEKLFWGIPLAVVFLVSCCGWGAMAKLPSCLARGRAVDADGAGNGNNTKTDADGDDGNGNGNNANANTDDNDNNHVHNNIMTDEESLDEKCPV